MSAVIQLLYWLDNATSDARELWKGVLLDPADDTQRLILADAMADGDEWNLPEFIRASVDGFRTGDEGDANAFLAVLFRGLQFNLRPNGISAASMIWGLDGWGITCHRDLFKKRIRESRIRSNVVKRHTQALLTRGFVSDIGLMWNEWREQADDLIARHPLEKVWLFDRPPLITRNGRDFIDIRPMWERMVAEIGPQWTPEVSSRIVKRLLGETWKLQFDMPTN